MSSKKYSKDDLRRLMQERKQEQLSNKKIDSLFAEYDQDDNLFCKICKLKIDNVNFWTKHLISKEHKLSLERIKKGQSSNQSNEKLNENKKRKLKDDGTNNTKQQKIESIKEPTKEVKNESKKVTDQDNNQSSGDLPKGFFDNPEEDAKARDEIYKNPIEDEWSKFQRSIQSEEKVVENIIENDLVETQNYRELIEIDEQLEHWNRINKLEIKREELKKSNKKMVVDQKEDLNDSDQSSENDLEDEFNILSNWRCKKTL